MEEWWCIFPEEADLTEEQSCLAERLKILYLIDFCCPKLSRLVLCGRFIVRLGSLVPLLVLYSRQDCW